MQYTQSVAWIQSYFSTPSNMLLAISGIQKASSIIVSLHTTTTRSICLTPIFSRDGFTVGICLTGTSTGRCVLNNRTNELYMTSGGEQWDMKLWPLKSMQVHTSANGVERYETRQQCLTCSKRGCTQHQPSLSVPNQPVDFSGFAANIALYSGGIGGGASVSTNVEAKRVHWYCRQQMSGAAGPGGG